MPGGSAKPKAKPSSADDILAGVDVGGLDTQTAASRGAPLLPYDVSPDLQGQVKVQNRTGLKYVAGKGLVEAFETSAPRYYEADALAPLSWSPELRAQLQKVMYGIGLYGNSKVTLGSWSHDDQGAFTQLLASANVDGRVWQDQLTFWKAHPPQDLLAPIDSAVPKKPTIQVTNPIDIRHSAETVSQNLTGRVDRAFTDASVAPYQQIEAGAQNAVYADQDQGGGGQTTQAPSMDAYLQDKMRREHPLEVDGYSFLNAFDAFNSMLGGGGA